MGERCQTRGMRIVVLGTGMVGRALAGGLSRAGHDVAVGTRDVATTLARQEPDPQGNPAFRDWLEQNPGVDLLGFADVQADVVVNATAGAGSLEALARVGATALSGTVLVDVANPLDFSHGFPPTLSVCNDDSLAEQIQRGYPEARVVKTLNTVTSAVMVDPTRLPGEHTMFLAGDDADAKRTARSLLLDLGWPAETVLDLGGLRAARGMEMYLPLWLSLMSSLGTGDFNVQVVR